MDSAIQQLIKRNKTMKTDSPYDRGDIHINKNDKVLEIGPGHNPTYRSNVIAEKFIDTNYFIQPIGNTSIGEREIDAQTWSSTQYTGLIMNGAEAVFGFNFVDGRFTISAQKTFELHFFS